MEIEKDTSGGGKKGLITRKNKKGITQKQRGKRGKEKKGIW